MPKALSLTFLRMAAFVSLQRMVINILAFGVAKEIMGSSSVSMDFTDNTTAAGIITHIREKYPAMYKLSSIALAVNGSYAPPETIITATDEVAIIPPVSGG